MNTRFIILVTQRNAEAFIRKCLDSILMQTYKNYEVIIMDDDSDDGTWEIIRDEYSQFQAIHTAKQPFHIANFIAGINLMATDREDVIVFVIIYIVTMHWSTLMKYIKKMCGLLMVISFVQADFTEKVVILFLTQGLIVKAVLGLPHIL